MKKILFQELNLRNKRILVLGAGGFTLSAQSDHSNDIIYNDIDGKIIQIAKNNFIKKINGKFIAGDARNVVKANQKPFNVIVSDVYSTGVSIPFHLITQEHFNNIRNALTPDGIAIFNIIARPTLSDKYSKRLNNTLLSVFQNCMIIPREYVDRVTNIIYVCKKSNISEGKTRYTDNMNQSVVDFYGIDQ